MATFRLTNGTPSTIVMEAPPASAGVPFRERKALKPGASTRQDMYVLVQPMSLVSGGCTYVYPKSYWQDFAKAWETIYPIQIGPDGLIYMRPRDRFGVDPLEKLQASQPAGWPIRPVSKTCP